MMYIIIGIQYYGNPNPATCHGNVLCTTCVMVAVMFSCRYHWSRSSRQVHCGEGHFRSSGMLRGNGGRGRLVVAGSRVVNISASLSNFVQGYFSPWGYDCSREEASIWSTPGYWSLSCIFALCLLFYFNDPKNPKP